ncbi:MAG: hypothetical protein LBG11_09575 [Bifidobacteriaceae bacterium]|jgi:hypothetical protein|nr:hypothetical protein [Bifidobacteriaceae bacterium]
MSAYQTVRVSDRAHLMLTELARARGTSRANLLEQLTVDAWWDEAMASERAARAADASSTAVAQEDQEWADAWAQDVD